MYEKNNLFEYNECIGRGMCSIFPTISSFQEIMLIIFRSVSYYIVKLERIGENCSEIKNKVIEGVSNLISTTGYSDEQLLSIIITAYNNLIKIRKKYLNLCKEKNITPRDIKLTLKLSPDMGLSEVLSLGHRAINDKNKKMNSIQKCYSELLFVLIKSTSLSVVKLFDYADTNEEAINNILTALTLYNFGTFPLKKAKNMISNLAETDLKLWRQRESAQIENFGHLSSTTVSLSTKPGKAILVSGSCLTDLKNILDSAGDIDVYTHGDLLIAHAFEQFRNYKNLKGHFGTSSDNCVLDFATFPGSIVLTKHSAQNIEYLIRGRLFTTDDFSPKGVVRILNNNFEPVIEAASASRGFLTGRKKDSLIVGFDYKILRQKIDELVKDLNTRKIRHLFIFGMSNYSEEQRGYFSRFIKYLPSDCYVISFSYNCDCDNLLYVNIANNFPLLTSVLSILFDKFSIKSDNLTIFLTKCDSNTMSIMVNLKQLGAKNIYLANCPPTIINPAVMNSFMNLYSIKPVTDAKTDLDSILK